MQTPEQEFADWQAHPMTGKVRATVEEFLKAQEMGCKEAAWCGEPWPDARREGLRMAMTMLHSVFYGEPADFLSWAPDEPMEP